MSYSMGLTGSRSLLFFFLLTTCARIFFSGETLCKNFFSNKQWFSLSEILIHYLFLCFINYSTLTTDQRMRAIFLLCVEDFLENLLIMRGGSNPKLTASLCIFVVPALWNSSDKNGMTGLHNSYPDVIAALKILFELVYLQGSASFVQYDSGILEYFAKLQ